MHRTLGQRDPAAAFPLTHTRDDTGKRRQANHAVAVSAVGLGVTGLVELAIEMILAALAAIRDGLGNPSAAP